MPAENGPRKFEDVADIFKALQQQDQTAQPTAAEQAPPALSPAARAMAELREQSARMAAGSRTAAQRQPELPPALPAARRGRVPATTRRTPEEILPVAAPPVAPTDGTNQLLIGALLGQGRTPVVAPAERKRYGRGVFAFGCAAVIAAGAYVMTHTELIDQFRNAADGHKTPQPVATSHHPTASPSPTHSATPSPSPSPTATGLPKQFVSKALGCNLFPTTINVGDSKAPLIINYPSSKLSKPNVAPSTSSTPPETKPTKTPTTKSSAPKTTKTTAAKNSVASPAEPALYGIPQGVFMEEITGDIKVSFCANDPTIDTYDKAQSSGVTAQVIDIDKSKLTPTLDFSDIQTKPMGLSTASQTRLKAAFATAKHPITDADIEKMNSFVTGMEPQLRVYALNALAALIDKGLDGEHNGETYSAELDGLVTTPLTTMVKQEADQTQGIQDYNFKLTAVNNIPTITSAINSMPAYKKTTPDSLKVGTKSYPYFTMGDATGQLTITSD